MQRLYVIGDSISIQYGPYLERYLRNRFVYSRKSGQEDALIDLDDPLGANGGDSTRVLEYLTSRAAMDPIEADYVLVNCGLHDVKVEIATGVRRVSISHYRDNLRSIVTVIRGMGSRPVWARTTPCDEAVHNVRNKDFHRFSRDVLDYNKVADEVMEEMKVPAIDLHSFTLNLGCDLYCDHVHFREDVREKQAAFLAGALTVICR